jgi:hypothetical protein
MAVHQTLEGDLPGHLEEALIRIVYFCAINDSSPPSSIVLSKLDIGKTIVAAGCTEHTSHGSD